MFVKFMHVWQTGHLGKHCAHLAMWSWSFDTPRAHSSLNSTAAQHGHHQQHEHTSSVVSSHVMIHLGHITIVGHSVVIRPTCKVEELCKSNSHEGSRTITRVSFTLGYIYPSFVHENNFSPWLLPHRLESLKYFLWGMSSGSNAPLSRLVM